VIDQKVQEALRSAGWACWHRPGPLKKDADGRYQLDAEAGDQS
jgi:hypothetical protein